MTSLSPGIPTDASAAEENHSSAVAHHFESAQQQFEAGKLGMWIFLATEVLFFGGLFVAYAVFRSGHPEVFSQASRHLSTTLGAINTVVLIFSSLTMAWAVRCAQLGQRRGLVWTLAVTLACAGFFLGIKAVEYSLKWDEGLLWAGSYAPVEIAASADESHSSGSLRLLSAPAWLVAGLFSLTAIGAWRLGSRKGLVSSVALAATAAAFLCGAAVGKTISSVEHAAHRTDVAEHPAAEHPAAEHPSLEKTAAAEMERPQAAAAGVFFSIYFSMTALHALHIVIGMAVIAWLIWGAAAGRFGKGRFAAVDFVGLYWHLVDLVWIFLFPMLYLIQ